MLLVFRSPIDWSEAFADVVKSGELGTVVKALFGPLGSRVLSSAFDASLVVVSCLIDVDEVGSISIRP